MTGNISKSKGVRGYRGEAFTYDDLIPEQKQELSAKITEVTASVDNTTGTPSVEVTMGGTENERKFALAFSGIKGDKGDKGDAFKYEDFTPEQLADLITNVYKFKGSVDTFDEYMTAATYELIPCGNPTYEGRVVGTYNAEERTVFIDSNLLPGWEDYDVVVPIKEITIPKGYYTCDKYISVAGMDGYWFDISPMAYKKTDEEVVSEVHIGTYGHLDSGTYQLGTLNKLSSVQVELAEYPVYSAEYSVVDTLDVGDVYNVLEDGMNYAWTGTKWDALGGEHKDLEAREEIKRLKERAVSAYRFCGSVENFEDLPAQYPLIPNGVPTFNGEPCGVYDEETHTVTIRDIKINDGNDKLIIPIVPISIKAGKYYCDNGSILSDFFMKIGVDANGQSFATYTSYAYDECCEMPSQVIEYIEVEDIYQNVEAVNGNTNYLGLLLKVIDSWCEDDRVDIPINAYDAGAVYEVKKTGIDDDGNDIATSYGWTGSTWDALGTSHIDQEAREDIKDLHDISGQLFGLCDGLESQMGDVESALDSIIEIQNSLMGGDSV